MKSGWNKNRLCWENNALFLMYAAEELNILLRCPKNAQQAVLFDYFVLMEWGKSRELLLSPAQCCTVLVPEGVFEGSVRSVLCSWFSGFAISQLVIVTTVAMLFWNKWPGELSGIFCKACYI